MLPALAAVLFTLPAFGVRLGTLLFLAPAALCAVAAFWSLRAAAARPQRALAWRCWAAGHATAAVCSVLALASSAVGGSAGLGLEVAVVASLAIVVGSVAFALDASRSARLVDVVDPLVLLSAAFAIVIDLVVIPGFRDGDWLLTTIVIADLLALFALGLAAVGGMPVGSKVGMLLVGGCVVAGDGLAAAEAAGTVDLRLGVVALIWALAASFATLAARAEVAGRPPRLRSAPRHAILAAWARLLLPLGALACLPLAGLAHHLFNPGGLTEGTAVFYRLWFVGVMVIAFTRQAGLLVENRRRAVELEALTDLATAMARTVDEEPMLDYCTATLRRVARASSAVVLAPSQAGPATLVAGYVLDLPLTAHDRDLGTLRIVRQRAEGRFSDRDVALLGILADQLAIGLQTTRDQRERLESVIRDPLTGLYNRRYFTEAFEKEIRRHERYGSTAALVVFDVDELKLLNDALGSEADSILRRIAEVVEPHIRPSDSFARLGGGEFALLLPETGQLDALLAAERIRTAISRTRLIPDRQVTVSGGVASMPQDGTTRAELERRAGAALSWAKHNGRNLCAVAREIDPDDAPELVEGMLAHLHAVVAGIDSAHLHTRDHSENVAAYAVAIAQELGLDEERIVRLRRAAFLHDIGKIAVPDAVLSKPDRLTEEEFEQIKVHPAVGGHMLAHAGLHAEAHWVRHHHERVDGGGYPDGVALDDLALESRIIFVADSFEAMTSDRPYRQGMPVDDAVAELRRCAGSQFDPEIVEAMCALLERNQLRVMSLKDMPSA